MPDHPHPDPSKAAPAGSNGSTSDGRIAAARTAAMSGGVPSGRATTAARATTGTAVVVDTSVSPNAAHRPVSIGDVHLEDAFLAPRIRINREVTIPSQYAHLEETKRLRNFRRAAGEFDGPFDGIYFNDSDVYKWLEAASSAIAGSPDEHVDDLREMVDTVVALIEGAQDETGYINTYFSVDRAGERWSNLRDLHELYCAGHLIQAAVAHYRATGSDRLLNVATRFADLICDTFGPATDGKREETDGHEEIELALIELYRATGERRYLEQARFFLDVRGRGTIGGSPYHQDATPLREQTDMVGHAVRAVYLNAGAADLVAEEDDAALRDALDAMWTNMTTRRAYVTGGIGSRWEGEAFGKDFELPNERAYTETCAAIGSIMWAWRMLTLRAEDNTRYADWIEHALYNAMLPGLSLDGQAYFYQNPLADEGTHRRQPWFGCACCPPNIARILAQLPGYLYSVTSRRFPESDGRHDSVWVHLFAAGTATIPLDGGGSVTLRQATRYPWDGEIVISIEALEEAGDFTLQARVPAWAGEATVEVNGERLPPSEAASGQYATMRRVWRVGDVVRLHLPMPPRRIVNHPRMAENAGRVALRRGPLLYCVEAADHPIGDVRDFVLPDDADIVAAQRPEDLNGIVVLTAEAVMESAAPAWDGALYRTVEDSARDQPGRSSVMLTAIPYYAWANRGSGPMTVWLRRG
ncbi:MAG TPA: beta-L-arabinofuranosidase domain-containing protein [Thermomicrobiales bacterium]|nr:beta-L-arabinofuranosidase domain-containing protein [Thermomicrobiales bacterium]